MNRLPTIETLLDHWEAEQAQGRELSPEELCRANPALLEEARRKISQLKAFASQQARLVSHRDFPGGHSPAQSPSILQPGLEPVPGYRLLSLLGRGGFGEVWKAVGPGGKHVALKFVPLQSSVGQMEMRSFELMKNISHPHLILILGAWMRSNSLVIAMELAEKSLADRLQEVQAKGLPGLPLKELLNHLHDAADGIDYLNTKRHLQADGSQQFIRHRDIKPQNLLLVGGRVKVADFGLAKAGDKLAAHSGGLTLHYAAPELFTVGASDTTDQYALAVSYCQLRNGRLPFEGSVESVVKGHLYHAPNLSMLNSAESAVVARALAKEPGERWQSCKKFLRELMRAAKGADSKVAHQPAPDPRPKAICPRCLRLASLPPGFRSGRYGCPHCKHEFVVAALVPTETEAAPVRQTEPGKVSVPQKPKYWAIRLVILFLVIGLLTAVVWKSLETNGIIKSAPSAGITNSIGMKFVQIPAGTFEMGSYPTEPERALDEPIHEVTITRPFYFGVYEVTQMEYEQIQVWRKRPCHFHLAGGGRPLVDGVDTRRFPAESMRWEQAVEFCKKLSELPAEKGAGRSYRLPTEAEWEYACRAGTKTPFHFGATITPATARFDYARPYAQGEKGAPPARPLPVGSFAPNQFGLYDMHGNVAEWCADSYESEYYGKGPKQDPINEKGGIPERKVIRGGSWEDRGTQCRSAFRSQGSTQNCYTGFRVVLEMTPVK
jgi:formylglycine-generating enzyme required for sulfatase activity/serine/threonine protein kinase